MPEEITIKAEAPEPEDKSEAIALGELRGMLAALQASMAGMPSSSDLEAIRLDLSSIKAELATLEIVPESPAVGDQVDRLEAKIEEMEAEPEASPIVEIPMQTPSSHEEVGQEEHHEKRGWSLW